MNIRLYVQNSPNPVVLTVRHGGTLPEYDGPYEVVPAVDEQVLETKEKRMADNVTIHGIPYAETTNASGTTAVIAS